LSNLGCLRLGLAPDEFPGNKAQDDRRAARARSTRKIFLRRGFEGASMDEIADCAWEALIVSISEGWSDHLEFQLLDSSGRF
jgi:hypothetical protein